MWGVIFKGSHVNSFFPLSISVSKSPKSRTLEPFDIPKYFLNDLSSPFTDFPDGDESEEEFRETTTHDPYPFFDEPSTQINVTTQLGTNVLLHCKVHDLREKTVSIEGL